MNNRKFFKLTHTDFTKQSLLQWANISALASELPEEYTSFYANKTILKDKGEMARLQIDQNLRGQSFRNRKQIGYI